MTDPCKHIWATLRAAEERGIWSSTDSGSSSFGGCARSPCAASIVKNTLHERGIAYEYLDGKTRDRAARVERFQNDASCGVFLVSLNAGGVGLNLTAADYVFILDPWWNPAVEQQAIDRAHRIGQTRSVVAYRLLAKNTVEEKVEELQNKKRALVRAVLGDESGLGCRLTREDLELLLG